MRVSTMTVYRLIRDGELPAIRVGKHFRLRAVDVDRFLSSRTVNPTDPRDTHYDTPHTTDADATDSLATDAHTTEEHRWRAG